jgi:hypothetical protein
MLQVVRESLQQDVLIYPDFPSKEQGQPASDLSPANCRTIRVQSGRLSNPGTGFTQINLKLLLPQEKLITFAA